MRVSFFLPFISSLLLYCIDGFLIARQPFIHHSIPTTSLRMSTKPLNIGDFESVAFTLEEIIDNNFGRFSVDATIKAKDMNVMLNEYKAEMKKRKVVFPGFRTGVLPPYVMGDIRRYIVCYGLETLLGKLGNLNGLQFCSKDKEDVEFGADAYYATILKEDFRGYGFEKQRDAWKEGTDFSFSAEFYAISDDPLTVGEEQSEVVVLNDGSPDIIIDAEN